MLFPIVAAVFHLARWPNACVTNASDELLFLSLMISMWPSNGGGRVNGKIAWVVFGRPLGPQDTMK